MVTIDKEAAFLSWLEKKNQEYKRVKTAREKALREQQEYVQYRITQGRLAYEKWLKGRLLAEEEIFREIIRQRQRKVLAIKEKEKRLEESTRAYQQWKTRKNAEIKLTNRSGGTLVYPPPRAETPTLPGYCSVWSCDPGMSVTMTTRVKRPLTYTLTELSPSYYNLHQIP